MGSHQVVNKIPDVLGADKIDDDNRWKLLRRSKQLLAMRTVTPELAVRLDLRRDWNVHRKVETLLDCFPSLKYSYSSLRGKKFGDTVSIRSNGVMARVDDIARSHSIRLDPVDSPKELFKYRLRIQKIIGWAYAKNLVPVLMTLTVFHRWNDLAPLIKVLNRSWSDLFAHSKAGLARREHIGLRGYVKRMEETFNDGDGDYDESLNSGWHPHYHVILIVPRDRLMMLSGYEKALRKVWVKLVRKYYVKEFGEDIPASYLESFEEHGLVFSRYKSSSHAKQCGNVHGSGGELFEVKDGKYLAKVMGTDEPLYGGDSELTSWTKKSKTPFDLLKCKVTANLSDLWCEYAIATKKIPCFTFSKGLKATVDEYIEKASGVTNASSALLSEPAPSSGRVIRLKAEDYVWLYRHFLIGQMLEVVGKGGYDEAKVWLKDSLGIEVVEEDATPSAMKDAQNTQEIVHGECDEECDEEVEEENMKTKEEEVLEIDKEQPTETVMIIRCEVPLTELEDLKYQHTEALKLPTQFESSNKSPP